MCVCITCGIFNGVVSSSHYVASSIRVCYESKLERMLMGALVAKLLVLSHSLPRGTKEECRMSQSDFSVSAPRLEPRRFKMCSSNAKHSVIKVLCFVFGGKVSKCHTKLNRN